ncbi:MAG: hypothetical protein V8Q30_04995 [Acutalibacteraceae bacterium]
MESSLADQFFQWVDTPEEADFALVFIESPLTDGYSGEEAAGRKRIPARLLPVPSLSGRHQARQHSVAGGDFRESSDNRSYRGKTGTAANEADLDLVLDARAAMGDEPDVCMRMHNPLCSPSWNPLLTQCSSTSASRSG